MSKLPLRGLALCFVFLTLSGNYWLVLMLTGRELPNWLAQAVQINVLLIVCFGVWSLVEFLSRKFEE